jgi:Fur family peroxide stress response transcriptional regulator
MLDELRAAGLKVTPQRDAIVRTLASDETHPTAQEIYDRLKAEFPNMSFATVYNTLSALTEIGRVQPLTLEGSPTRFDPNVEPHHHAVCDECGAVRDVPIRSRGREPRRVLGDFQVHRVERIYRGLCAACREAAEQ